MDRIVSDPLLAALGEIIENTLVHGDSVYIKDLGTFTVHHRPSIPDVRDDGNVVIPPPADEISFSTDR